jgi:threonine dehydratase
MVTVDTDEICAAIKDVFEDTRSILEPAGALSVAGMKKDVARRQLRDRTLVAVACGLLGLALTSWTVLARRLVAERAAAERWIVETVASLRVALEERVLTRMLAAECARAGDTPNYRPLSRPR